MTNEELSYIQKKINYQFRNPQLLQQAFIRRSYSQENPQWQNNEVLEFIGDSELDSFIVRKLCGEFANIDNSDRQFYCKKNEGDLTKLKTQYVDKESLAHCIELLGFNKYLIMGKSDIKNNASESLSVKEDLFEAIVGAVAVDSNFNQDTVNTVCATMLGYIDFDDDYVELIKEWCKKHDYIEPQYNVNIWKTEDDLFTCTVYTHRLITYEQIRKEGKGKTKELAMMDAAESFYYDFCEIMDMRSAVGEPNEELSVSQLHELSQKGFFEEPEYSYEEEHDNDGCPVWKCSCNISGYDEYYWATASTKKEAKRNAAYSELLYVLDLSEKNGGSSW